MDVAQLVSELVDALNRSLPTLLAVGSKVGEKALEEAGKKVGAESFDKAKSLWRELWPKMEAKPATVDAAKDLAESPDDLNAQAALRSQLREILDVDHDLAEVIARILMLGTKEVKLHGSGALSWGRENVTASSGGIAIGGDVVFGGDKDRRASDKDYDSFVEGYRRCMRRAVDHWEMVSGGFAHVPRVPLERMYIPLRFVPEATHESPARSIGARDLLNYRESLIVRGEAGAGKSTWVLWTFRELLEASDAFPLLLIVRKLIKRWQAGAEGIQRSLLGFLKSEVEEQLGYKCGKHLRRIMEGAAPVRPVLMVDGWDEAGQVWGGDLFRAVQGLMGLNPGLRVVITTRPGEGRAVETEDFRTYSVYPLALDDAYGFAERFFAQINRASPGMATSGACRFRAELERSPDVQSLARTAHFLTMLVSAALADGALPNERHRLYEFIIDSMLEGPALRVREGAALPLFDREESKIAAAQLAHGVQKGGQRLATDAEIALTETEMASLLPLHWRLQARKEFLLWLSEAVGLLTQWTNKMMRYLAFSHLGFQEFLAAWWLQEHEGSRAADAFRELAGEPSWWRVLRLWAALIHDGDPETLDAILDDLLEGSDEELSLLGQLLADGYGAEEQFQAWLKQTLGSLSCGWFEGAGVTSLTWETSRREEWREQVGAAIKARIPSERWMGWLRLHEFARWAPDRRSSTRPEHETDRIVLSQLLSIPPGEPTWAATTRFLCGGFPLWPFEPVQVGLLQLWPSGRRLAGLRLQLAASCGAERADLVRLTERLLRPHVWSIKDEEAACRLALALKRALGQEGRNPLVGDWARFLIAEEFRSGLEIEELLLKNAWLSTGGREWAREFERRSRRPIARQVQSRWPSFRAREWILSLVRVPRISQATGWEADFALIDLCSIGRFGVRAFVASMSTEVSAEVSLLAAACRFSISGREDEAVSLAETLETLSPSLHPLWAALGRHVARKSSDEDKALLDNLARNPEQCPAPLSWGLRYIVGGVVVLRDGSEVTLDELAAQSGLASPPYLEDVLPEMQLDLPG